MATVTMVTMDTTTTLHPSPTHTITMDTTVGPSHTITTLPTLLTTISTITMAASRDAVPYFKL
jgi:hypothetical protein